MDRSVGQVAKIMTNANRSYRTDVLSKLRVSNLVLSSLIHTDFHDLGKRKGRKHCPLKELISALLKDKGRNFHELSSFKE